MCPNPPIPNGEPVVSTEKRADQPLSGTTVALLQSQPQKPVAAHTVGASIVGDFDHASAFAQFRRSVALEVFTFLSVKDLAHVSPSVFEHCMRTYCAAQHRVHPRDTRSWPRGVRAVARLQLLLCRIAPVQT